MIAVLCETRHQGGCYITHQLRLTAACYEGGAAISVSQCWTLVALCASVLWSCRFGLADFIKELQIISGRTIYAQLVTEFRFFNIRRVQGMTIANKTPEIESFIVRHNCVDDVFFNRKVLRERVYTRPNDGFCRFDRHSFSQTERGYLVESVNHLASIPHFTIKSWRDADIADSKSHEP